jgi:hypothetical protein
LDSSFLARYDLGCLFIEGLLDVTAGGGTGEAEFACTVREADAGASPSNPKSLSVTGAALAAEDDEEAADEEETARWGDEDAPLPLLVLGAFEIEVAAGVVDGFAGVARAGDSGGFGAFGGDAGLTVNPANKSMLALCYVGYEINDSIATDIPQLVLSIHDQDNNLE